MTGFHKTGKGPLQTRRRVWYPSFLFEGSFSKDAELSQSLLLTCLLQYFPSQFQKLLSLLLHPPPSSFSFPSSNYSSFFSSFSVYSSLSVLDLHMVTSTLLWSFTLISLYIFWFWESVLLRYQIWTWSHSVAQAGFELVILCFPSSCDIM